MRHTTKRILVRMIMPILVGPILGAVAAAVYATLCMTIYWALTQRSTTMIPTVMWFGLAGAIVGTITGVCRAIDRP